MKEWTEEEAIKEAKKRVPLPEFSAEEELQEAMLFATRRSKRVALFFMGVASPITRTEWKRERRELLEIKRFRQWCSLYNCQYDHQRRKWLQISL
mgnify:CR=1 FL=1